MIISQPYKDTLLLLLLCVEGKEKKKKALYVTPCLTFQK